MPRELPSERYGPRHEARQHWIVLLTRKPHRRWLVLLVVLAVVALFGPWWATVAFLAALVLLAVTRYRVWHAERVILTARRIVHVQGILETTRTETSMRLDRISGLRLVETFPGRVLGYATISVEAPGEHPGLKRLYRMARLDDFYLYLRDAVFGEPSGPDPDFESAPGDPRVNPDYVTEELPDLDRRDRFGRRRY